MRLAASPSVVLSNCCCSWLSSARMPRCSSSCWGVGSRSSIINTSTLSRAKASLCSNAEAILVIDRSGSAASACHTSSREGGCWPVYWAPQSTVKKKRKCLGFCRCYLTTDLNCFSLEALICLTKAIDECFEAFFGSRLRFGWCWSVLCYCHAEILSVFGELRH